MNDFSIRIASTHDAEAISSLVNRAYRPEKDAGGWTHESDLVSGSRTNTIHVETLVSKPNSIIFIALKDAEIVACVHVERHDDHCHIGLLAVSPALQGAGLGKRMLDYAEGYARDIFGSEKCTMMVVSARDELISFYLRRGYRQTGHTVDYPLCEDVGIPKYPDLKVEVLEKHIARSGI